MGADLLEGSTAWTSTDRDDLRAWMRDVLLPAASHRPNNWGDAGTFLRVVAADYAGDADAFAAALDTWRSFVDLIEADAGNSTLDGGADSDTASFAGIDPDGIALVNATGHVVEFLSYGGSFTAVGGPAAQ